MLPGGGGRGEHGCALQGHPPVTVSPDEDTPPLPVPSQEKKKKKQKLVQDQDQEQEQQIVPSLPEGALVEILSRVPYRSLCRFKCVSKPWLALCSAPDIIKMSLQTLYGFFYYDDERLCFHNLYGRAPPLVDPSLPFLRSIYKYVHVEQFCDSLLLCRCWNSRVPHEGDYVVCNPATQEWIVLPPVVFSGQDQEFSHNVAPWLYLGFEAAVPSRFVLFASPYSGGGGASREMAIYSSETGQWNYVQSKWASGSNLALNRRARVLLNGTMHLSARYMYNTILTVDTEGKIWREVPFPLPSISDIFFTGQSQGRFYLWQTDYRHDWQLYIWVLEDYGTGKWTLKHTVNVLELFGRHRPKDDELYLMFAIHPDCNVIFLTDEKNMTLSYDMDNKKVNVICTESMYGWPYIPCFGELPSAGH